MTITLEEATAALADRPDVKLLIDCVQFFLDEGYATQASLPEWVEFSRAGMELWKDRGDSWMFQEHMAQPASQRFSRVNTYDQDKADNWLGRWREWLWAGYTIVRTYDEARASDLMCRVACRSIAEQLEYAIPDHLDEYEEVLGRLRPALPTTHRELAACLKAVKDRQGRY